MGLIRSGAAAGLFAGLLVAGREVALAETQSLWLSDLWSALPWHSLEILAYALLGTIAGILLALLLGSILRRARARDALGELPWFAPVTAGGLILFFAGVYRAQSLAGWPELLALVLIAIGVTLVLNERLDVAPVSRALASGLGILVGEFAFFLVADRIADATHRPVLMQAAAYLGAVVMAGLVGWTAARALGWIASRVSERWSERASSYGLAALMVIPVLIFSAAGIISLAVPRSMPQASAGEAAGVLDGPRPNVILISVDTLRADYLGYAGGPARTPNLDALAAESYVFENAYSVAPWTRPSFASLFSSRYPSEMGVARTRGVGGAKWDAPVPYRWADEPITLAEALRDAGYMTAAVVTNHQLAPDANADQGFQFFHHCSRTVGRDREHPDMARAFAESMSILWGPLALKPSIDDMERAEIVTRAALDVIPWDDASPMLSWLHYMDPHEPYDPPSILEERRVDPPKYATMAGAVNRSGPERQAFIDAYVAEIEYNDEWVGSLLRQLKSEGLWDSSIIVFFSDHGEEFWEHGKWEHGQSLHPEVCRVPLLIHLPGQDTGDHLGDPVTLLDVMPTVLDLCDVGGPDGMRGRSLTPVLGEGDGDLEDLRAFMEGCLWGEPRKALLTDRYRLELNLYSNEFSLYDLAVDPGERHNIYGTPLAPDTTEMERELLDWTEKSLARMDQYVAKQGAEDVPPEVLERLRDMGYIQ